MNLMIRDAPDYDLVCSHCGYRRKATEDERLMSPDNRPKCPHGCESKPEPFEKRMKEPGEELLK